MKRWHKSMKRKPRVGEDILIIWTNNDVEIGKMMIDEFGESYLFCNSESYDWETVEPIIKQWAYVDKYFEKELNAGN